MIRQFAYPAPQALAQALAGVVVQDLEHAIARHGTASLVVSGGRTPKRLFDMLGHCDLDWAKVKVTLADERLVSRDSPDLNANLVRESLLKGKAATARFYPLWDGQGDPRTIAQATLAQFPESFDLVLLGMGEDGHTASLFPQSPGLDAALDAGNNEPLLILPAIPARQARVSLTLSRLRRARHMLLAFEGPAKRAVFETALQSGPETELPVRAILRSPAPPVDVHWSQS